MPYMNQGKGEKKKKNLEKIQKTVRKNGNKRKSYDIQKKFWTHLEKWLKNRHCLIFVHRKKKISVYNIIVKKLTEESSCTEVNLESRGNTARRRYR